MYYAIPAGEINGGWYLTAEQLHLGSIRITYPFIAGMLMARTLKIRYVQSGFLLSSVLLVAVLLTPRLGGDSQIWINGLYESLAVIIIFPIVIYFGAGAKLAGDKSQKFCRFLGNISYPMYIAHAPFLYIYAGWVSDNKSNPNYLNLTIIYGFILFVTAIAVGYLSFRFYDEPVRKWIRNRFLNK